MARGGSCERQMTSPICWPFASHDCCASEGSTSTATFHIYAHLDAPNGGRKETQYIYADTH